MRAPEQLLARLRTTWSRQRRDWLLSGGAWPCSLSTEPPTEKQAMADWAAFDRWLRLWREMAGREQGRVQFHAVKWGKVGEQVLPERWLFDTPETVAAALGEEHRWWQAKRRFDALTLGATDAGGDPEAMDRWRHELARHFDVLADFADDRFERLRRVVEWLRGHPRSGLYPRQLPIAGVDSKWLESHRAVVAAWVAAWTGSDAAGFHAATGLRAAPDRLRMRVLDPELRKSLRGLSDIEAPVEEFLSLELPARQVFIVENLFTGLAFGDLPSAVVFMRRGYAVEALAQLPWLRDLPVVYWGDLDTHGFAILSRLRGYLPWVRSVLMDRETFAAHEALAVEESAPHVAQELPHLTPGEQALFAALGGRRLEQERIAWDWAWPRLVAEAGSASFGRK
jgi:hypothetical protein